MIKRFLSIILCLLFVVIAGKSTYAANSTEMSANDFSNQINLFISDNEEYETYDVSPSSGETEISINTNRLIVSDDSNTPISNDYGAVSKLEGFNGIYILQYDSELDADNAYNSFRTQNNINYVEYDEVMLLDDLLIDESLNVNNTQQSNSKLNNEWGSKAVHSSVAVSVVNSALLTNRRIVVAVIDTGVDENHSFFKIGNDDNRILPSNRPADNSPSVLVKNYTHGTHVAGIIVNNTPENVRIRSFNYFYYQSNVDKVVTTTTKLYSEIELAIAENVDVINMSLAGKGTSSSVEQSINNAISHNIPVVCSAGNENDNVNNYYPANIESTITVGATNSSNEPCSFSNYGSLIDLSAPGAAINSSIPDNKYTFKDGTSMAAPFVSAAAAILKIVIINITPQQIKERLKSTAYTPPDWNSYNNNYGTGIVDFKNMIADMMTSTPTIIVGSNSATITYETGATVYYTTSKSDPNIESTVYSGPISTGNIKEIRAIAVRSGYLPSPIAIHTFESDQYINVIINKSKNVDFSGGITARYVDNQNPEIAILSPDGTIEGIAIGEAVCVAFFSNNHRVVYHIKVDYHPIIKILRLIFFWLFWILDKR